MDPFVFPELDRGRNGDSLEARFNAFKIPESNFLVFEATVRSCRDECQPAYCQSGSGRSEPSFGRRKRDLNSALTPPLESNDTLAVGRQEQEEEDPTGNITSTFVAKDKIPADAAVGKRDEEEEPEYVREMIEVFDSREELQQEARRAIPVPETTVCLTNGEYQGLIAAVLLLAAALVTVALLVGMAYRRYWLVMKKNAAVDRPPSSSSYPTTTRSSGFSNFSAVGAFGSGLQRRPFAGFGRTTRNFPVPRKEDEDEEGGGGAECVVSPPGGPFEDPSEPIYTDPSLFERSRSLRSIAVIQKKHSLNP